MSAKTLTSLYGHPSGTILRDVSYDILTRLVQAGLATWDLTGGVEQVRPTINTRATFQEQQLFVPDNALDPDSGSSPVTAVVNPGGGTGIKNILSLTQAQYDAIVTKDAATLYVIVEG